MRELASQCQESGMPVNRWCRLNHVPTTTCRQWLLKLKKQELNENAENDTELKIWGKVDLEHLDSIYVACGPTNLRNNVDGLSILVRQSFGLDTEEKYRTCDACGSKIRYPGKEHVRDEIEIIPQKMYMKRCCPCDVSKICKCNAHCPSGKRLVLSGSSGRQGNSGQLGTEVRKRASVSSL